MPSLPKGCGGRSQSQGQLTSRDSSAWEHRVRDEGLVHVQRLLQRWRAAGRRGTVALARSPGSRCGASLAGKGRPKVLNSHTWGRHLPQSAWTQRRSAPAPAPPAPPLAPAHPGAALLGGGRQTSASAAPAAHGRRYHSHIPPPSAAQSARCAAPPASRCTPPLQPACKREGRLQAWSLGAAPCSPCGWAPCIPRMDLPPAASSFFTCPGASAAALRSRYGPAAPGAGCPSLDLLEVGMATAQEVGVMHGIGGSSGAL